MFLDFGWALPCFAIEIRLDAVSGGPYLGIYELPRHGVIFVVLASFTLLMVLEASYSPLWLWIISFDPQFDEIEEYGFMFSPMLILDVSCLVRRICHFLYANNMVLEKSNRCTLMVSLFLITVNHEVTSLRSNIQVRFTMFARLVVQCFMVRFTVSLSFS